MCEMMHTMSFEPIGIKRLSDYIQDSNTIIIDLRTIEEYLEGHVPNSVHIDMEDFERKIKYYDPEKILVLYCERGGKSMAAAKKADQMGFEVKTIVGGYQAIQRAGI